MDEHSRALQNQLAQSSHPPKLVKIWRYREPGKEEDAAYVVEQRLPLQSNRRVELTLQIFPVPVAGFDYIKIKDYLQSLDFQSFARLIETKQLTPIDEHWAKDDHAVTTGDQAE